MKRGYQPAASSLGLNRCGAKCWQVLSQGFQTALGGQSYRGSRRSAKRPSCRTARVALPSGHLHRFLREQGVGIPQRVPSSAGKTSNPHRMKDLQRGPTADPTSEKMAQPGNRSASTPRQAVRRPQAVVATTADVSRRPEILKPAPIGHFVRFLLRALF